MLGSLDRLSLLTVDTLLVNSSVAPLGFPPARNGSQHSLQSGLPIVSGSSGGVSIQIEKIFHDFKISKIRTIPVVSIFSISSAFPPSARPGKEHFNWLGYLGQVSRSLRVWKRLYYKGYVEAPRFRYLVAGGYSNTRLSKIRSEGSGIAVPNRRMLLSNQPSRNPQAPPHPQWVVEGLLLVQA